MDQGMTLIGWVGGILYLLAYLCLVKGWLLGTSYRFHGANITSGSLLALSCAYFGAIPSMVINIVFVAIGVYYVTQKSWRSARMQVVSAQTVHFDSAHPANQSLEAA
jgi:hypothetical protein